MMEPKVLTIQDVSCFGQCSLTVALPILSAMGLETAILPSAVLSTHTGGFSGYTFHDLTADLPSIAAHWRKEGIFFDAFYSGYIGNKKQFSYIKDIVKDRANEGAKFIVDPVLGDGGRYYAGFDESYTQAMRVFLSGADVILPNLSEASFLLKEEYLAENYTEKRIEKILRDLSDLCGGSVVLTGVSFDPKVLGAAVFDRKNNTVDYAFEERISGSFHGTGDIFASVFTGSLMQGASPANAARKAAAFTVRAIRATLDDRNGHWYGVKFEKALPFLLANKED